MEKGGDWQNARGWGTPGREYQAEKGGTGKTPGEGVAPGRKKGPPGKRMPGRKKEGARQKAPGRKRGLWKRPGEKCCGGHLGPTSEVGCISITGYCRLHQQHKQITLANITSGISSSVC